MTSFYHVPLAIIFGCVSLTIFIFVGEHLMVVICTTMNFVLIYHFDYIYIFLMKMHSNICCFEEIYSKSYMFIIYKICEAYDLQNI